MKVARSRTVLQLVLAGLLFFLCPSAEAQIRNLKIHLGKGMPLWPILAQTSHPIDPALIDRWRKWARKCEADKEGRYSAFPSKYKDQLANAEDDEKCDDGDMTSFNGLLCAVGLAEGCAAVRQAIAPTDGRWFRSPKRRAFGQQWCSKGQKVVDAFSDYCERCVSTFSPDMSLGVMLFAVAEKDRDSFANWLRWLDRVRLPIALCEGAVCEQLPWIRYCTDDEPCKRKQSLKDAGLEDRTGGTYMFGFRDKKLYLGGCTARPWDAFDFSVTRRALNLSGVSPGVEAYIQAAERVLPVDQKTFGLLSSVFTSTDKKGFPLHLDAVRVLLRMLINNPSLGQGWDAILPDPIMVGFPFQDGSDLFDPISLNATARIISSRAPDNPFFKLLAEGPSDSVREQILRLCPDPEATEETTKAEETRPKTEWMWEALQKELPAKQSQRMQWDCVFVGKLFNKMRVRSWNLDDLLKAFLKTLDPINAAVKQLELAITVAQANVAALQRTLDLTKGAKRSFARLNSDFDLLQTTRKMRLDQIESEAARAFVPARQEKGGGGLLTLPPLPSIAGIPGSTLLGGPLSLNELPQALQVARNELAQVAEKFRDKWIKKFMDADEQAIRLAERALEDAKHKLDKLEADLHSAKREYDIVTGYKEVMLLRH